MGPCTIMTHEPMPLQPHPCPWTCPVNTFIYMLWLWSLAWSENIIICIMILDVVCHWPCIVIIIFDVAVSFADTIKVAFINYICLRMVYNLWFGWKHLRLILIANSYLFVLSNFYLRDLMIWIVLGFLLVCIVDRLWFDDLDSSRDLMHH